jgi:hypothetical protein
MHRYILTVLVVLLSLTKVVGQEPVKVDTNGLVAKIKFESVLAGFLTELNDRCKLRVTELTLAPGDMSASTIMWAPAFAWSPPAR